MVSSQPLTPVVACTDVLTYVLRGRVQTAHPGGMMMNGARRLYNAVAVPKITCTWSASQKSLYSPACVLPPPSLTMVQWDACTATGMATGMATGIVVDNSLDSAIHCTLRACG